MFKKLAVLAVIISLLLPALSARADGPITLGLGRLTAIALSPDGKHLAVGTTIGVYFYDPETFSPQRFWNTPDTVNYIRWSPAGDMVAVVDGYTQAEFRSATTGNIAWSTPTCYECAILFDADGARVTVATDSNHSIVFDTHSGISLKEVPGYLGPRIDWIVSLSPDRRWQAYVDTGGDINLHLAAGSHSRSTWLYNNHGSFSSPRTIAWSPDSHQLYAAVDNTVTVWDVDTGQKLRVLDGFSPQVYAVQWAPDNHHILSAEGENLVLSDVESQLPIEASQLPLGANRIIWNATHSMLAVSNLDGFVTLHDATTLQEIRRIFVGRYIRALVFSPDGQYLLTGGNGPFINMWNTTTGRAVHDLLGSPTTQGILALVFSPDGQAAYALEAGGTLRRWDMSTLSATTVRMAVPDLSNAVRAGDINLAANRVVITGDAKVDVMDATTGALVFSLDTGQVWDLAVNPQGTRLATKGQRPIGIWDLQTGQRVAQYTSDYNFLISLAFSPDGKSLASGGNGVIQIWPVP